MRILVFLMHRTVILIHVFRFLVNICRFMVRQARCRGGQNFRVAAFKFTRISFFFQIRFHCCVGSIANNGTTIRAVTAADSTAAGAYGFCYGICLLIIFHSTFACWYRIVNFAFGALSLFHRLIAGGFLSIGLM